LRARGKNGVGVGRTQTARGMLTHVLRLRAGHVEVYRVHTPTDRHFVDAARLTAQFEALRAARDVADASPQQILECAILALDPCVPHRVEWREEMAQDA
jgi:coenzyme F420-reducing hydrogenase alpha subunit